MYVLYMIGVPCINNSQLNTYKCDLGLARAAMSGVYCMFGVPSQACHNIYNTYCTCMYIC